MVVELIVYGIILGSIITLGAVGLTLIYGILRFANFSHGDLMTFGAYGALLFALLFSLLGVPEGGLKPFSFGLNLLMAIPPAAALTAGVAIAIDRTLYRRLRSLRLHPILIAMASLGMAFFLRSIIYLIWGPDFRFYVIGLRETWLLPLGVRLRPDQLFILAVALGMVIGLYLFLKYTKMGKALRAAADNPDLAQACGINIGMVVIWTWLIGGMMAGTAGILLGIDSQLRPEMGWIFLIPLFAAVIVGGIGNPYGALAGGLIIGVVQQVSTYWLLPAYKPAVAFLILILLLLFRPQGIFGGR